MGMNMDNVSWRYSAYLLMIPTFLLYVLTLTGCVSDSPGLQNIFLVQLQSGNDNSTAPQNFTEIRVGYFGICLKAASETKCMSSAINTAESLSSRFNSTSGLGTTETSQATTLVSLGLTLQSRVYLQLFAAAGIFYLFSAILFALLKWKEKRNALPIVAPRTNSMRSSLLGVVWISVGLAIVSSVAITQVSSALQFWDTALIKLSEETDVVLKAGSAIQVLQWITVGCSTLFAVAISLMLKPKTFGLPGPGGKGGPAKPPVVAGPRPGAPANVASAPSRSPRPVQARPKPLATSQ